MQHLRQPPGIKLFRMELAERNVHMQINRLKSARNFTYQKVIIIIITIIIVHLS